ncbi:hypothetical protein ULMS_12730 [Patiriisocius marinistellae]|uniref:HYR domain-containing protein n=1 Tax=Patiriisocius marinistellae TaxID=2494560 RepID=A0A5J4G0D6_9FLAO|nr:HYR domain-containing protein [Patiriisocius marinistellae]GEQ85765.1 hypothetical protein ULMS_12730 [Patiriisocius marinistellae]
MKKNTLLFITIAFFLFSYSGFTQCGPGQNISQNIEQVSLPSQPGDAYGQSFTTFCNGSIESLTVYTNGQASATLLMTIFEGTDATTPLATQPFTINNGTTEFLIPFPSNPAVINGGVYTYIISGQTLPISWQASFGNAYPNGSILELQPGEFPNYHDPTFDFRFIVGFVDEVDPIAICQDITVQLDATGNVTILPSSIDGGTSDDSGSFTLTLDNDTFDCNNVGANMVQLTATDAAGNSDICNATITIEDTMPPIITCPEDITESADINCMFTLDDYRALATVTDNCAASISITQNPAPGTAIGLGVTQITLEATDGTNAIDCIFNVTIVDDTPPVINCPSDQTRIVNINCEYVIQDYRFIATFSDNCNSIIISQTPPIGTIVGPGTVQITLEATDGTNTENCMFDLTVIDNEDPLLICPSAQTENADTNCQFEVPDYSLLASIEDRCGIASIVQTPAAGTFIGIGDTLIDLVVTDTSNNSSICNFTLTVLDNTPPIIGCPLNQTVSADINCGFILEDYTTLATTSDNCGNVTITQNPVAGTTILTGTTTITLFANDGTNSNTCTFDITVIDDTPPEISCPADITENVDASCTFTLGNYTTLATATDNCTIVSITQSPVPGTAVMAGVTQITLTAFDGTNTTDCNFNITVIDGTPPEITCPDNQTESANADCQFEVPDYTALAVFSDDCGISTVTQTPTAGTLVNIGNTIVEISVSDGTNTESCSFNLNVIDDTPPIIGCPLNQTVSADINCGFILEDYTTLAITSDNCGNVTITQNPVAGTTILTGTTTITLFANDGTNSNTCTFDITVIDNTPPEISCPADITENVDATCTFTIEDYTTLATATDNCTIVSITQSPVPGTAVIAGVTQITLTTFDGTNTTDCNFNITVIDGTPPEITCPDNQTESANADCQFEVPDYTALAVFSDDCGITTVTQTPTAGTLVNIGNTIVEISVSDGTNTESCSFNLNVIDDTPLVIECPMNETVSADINCEFIIPDYTSIIMTIENCGPVTVTQNPVAGTIVSTGANTITISADDGQDFVECMFDVIVNDNIPPTISCPIDQFESVDVDCMFSVPDYTSLALAMDNCTVISVEQNPLPGTLVGLGDTTITLIVSDGTNTDTCSFNLNVKDNTPPVVTCPDNITAFGDPNTCDFIVPDYLSLVTASDNCSIVSVTQDPPVGTIVTPGNLIVTFTAFDGLNETSCDFTVTIIDNTPPTIMCPPTQIVTVNSDCQFILPDYTSLVTANDACSTPTIVQTPLAGTIVNVGTTIVTMEASDSQNTTSCTFEVILEDNTNPIAICQDFTILLDALGTATLSPSDIDDGSSDSCSTVSLTVDIDTFDCSNIGINPVVLTVTDNAGNTSSCTAMVTVEDIIAPQAICQNITIQLDALGMAVITPAEIDGGSTDACGINNLAIDITTFDCSNIGTNNVTLFVSDNNGNNSSCVSIVTVEDTLPPTAICQDITVQLDTMGIANIVAADVNNGSTDNCGVDTISIDINTFDCSNIGTNNVTLTVTDIFGNSSQCTAIVTVENNNIPTAICQNITVQLDTTGMVTIIPSDIDGGSVLTCIATTPLSIDIDTFDCSNIGPNDVILTVTDDQGNTNSCTATVTVEDTIAPQVLCQNITVQLDATGTISITPAAIDGGSSDACGISATSIDIDTFDCSNIGANNVTLTVTDINGNTQSCIAVVTVEETENPIALCQNITVSLDASGFVTIIPSDVDAGSSDNCSIATIMIDNDTFDCTNIGENDVILTVTDTFGNESSCTAVVTIEDTTAPTAVCQDITVMLDANGTATITAADVDGGSSDACGIEFTAIDITSFDCSDVGANNVILTVIDLYGNEATCTAVVTVNELNATPIAVCQNVTIPLMQNGTATLLPQALDGGSSGAGCSNGLSIDINTFDCSDIGTPVMVTLTITNGNGDTDSCVAFVNVIDGLAPEVLCPADQTVISTGPYVLPDYFATGEAMAIDNCTDPVTVTDQDPNPGTLLEQGTHIITLSAQDNNGFEGECTFVLTVDDTLGNNTSQISLATITLYPNPATNYIILSNPQNAALTSLSIYNLNGKLVQNEDLIMMGVNKKIDVSLLQSANYLVIIESEQGQITKQLLIE